MDLLEKRQQYIGLLDQINQAMQEMEKQFAELQVKKERVIGGIMALDELLNSENSEQPDGKTEN